MRTAPRGRPAAGRPEEMRAMRGLLDVFFLAILVVAFWAYVLHTKRPEPEQTAFRPLPTSSALSRECAELINSPLKGMLDEPVSDANCP